MTKNREYQMCSLSVMDTTDPDIVFDDKGVCNHYISAKEKLDGITFESNQTRDLELEKIVNKIKTKGRNKKYDCVIGLSGGVDSSYLAYKVKKMGLRPLAVHLDNGWNSELAVKNIETIVTKLEIDLYTHVIDWEEFRSLQSAFLKAGVVDLEMLSDNAIVVSIYRIMKKYKINTFLIGSNLASESIMPQSWLYQPKYDSLNIRSIYKKFGNRMKLKTFPLLSLYEYIRYHYFNAHNAIALLDYMDYNKPQVLRFLEEELDYKPYPGKHYESKITRFYQAYILPVKYNIDKRKAHLSSLIVSKQISREEALEELKKPLFQSDLEKENDIDFFCKKMRISREEFNIIIKSDRVKHHFYSSYQKWHLWLRDLIKGKN